MGFLVLIKCLLYLYMCEISVYYDLYDYLYA
jgi:hypothetical protein